jgi:large subunit ribosomal protein L2
MPVMRYHIAPHEMKVGDVMMAGDNATDVPIKTGNTLPLREIPLRMPIFNLELRPGEGAAISRAANTHAVVLTKREDGFCVVRLPSGEAITFLLALYRQSVR